MSISVQYEVISCCVHLALVLARVPGLHPRDPQAPLAAVLAVENAEPEGEEFDMRGIMTITRLLHSLHSQQRLVINEKRKEFLMKASYQWEFL